MPLSSLTDAKLWSLILVDDYRAFTALYERHWLKLYRLSYRYIKDTDACEEVVHDLFVNLWRGRNNLIIQDYDSYLKAAIRYQVFAYLKKSKKSILDFGNLYLEKETKVDSNIGYEKIAYAELENEVNQQLESLPKRCREVFLLSRKHYLTNNEIAEKLGISKRTVENQITCALKHLRVYLKHSAY